MTERVTERESYRERERETERDSLNVIFNYTGIDCDLKSNSVRQIEMVSLTGRSSSIHLSAFVIRMYER